MDTGAAAVLFDESGSLAPDGSPIDARLSSTPLAFEWTRPATTNVVVPPDGRSTVALMAPVPDGAPHAAPPAAAHVHWILVNSDANASLTRAPAIALGPRFVTTIVQVSAPPA